MNNPFLDANRTVKHRSYPNEVVWVVTPQGEPKDIEVSTTLHSPFLEVTYDRMVLPDGKIRNREIVNVELSRTAERMGYKLLRHLYEEEGMAEGFDIFKAFIVECKVKGIHGSRAIVPDEYLPDALLEMRRKAKTPEVNLPPSPKRAKKVGKDARP